MAAIPSATVSVARVLQALLEDPGACAQLTVTGLALRTATSEATVVRTARSLGFAGYPQLRLALAAAAVDGARPPAPDLLTATATSDPAQVVATLAALETEAITATARTLDVTALTAAAEAVARARVVDCCGIGTSAVVALDLDAKLARLGLVGRPRTEGHAALVSAAGLQAGDVLVAVSHSGRTPDVVGAAREASARGAAVVALTGTASSPLASAADHVLLAAGRETALRAGAMASRTSSLMVVDCLYVSVAQLLGEPARRSIERTYRAVTAPAHRDR
nr:MurR/RpiR family transcriptional regulator [Kineococcus siccus]